MLRLFTAISLDSALLTALNEMQQALAVRSIEGLRLVSREHLHLTLRFMGDVREESLPQIGADLEECAAGFAPFQLRLHGAGAFPPAGAPRVLWCGVDNPGPARNLKTALDAALEAHCPETERREYSPHITIARIKDGRAAAKIRKIVGELEIREEAQEVNTVTLYKSTLLPGGPLHEILRSFRLRAVT